MESSCGIAAFSSASISSISVSPSPIDKPSAKSALIATNTASGAIWTVRTWFTDRIALRVSRCRRTRSTSAGSALSPISSPLASRASSKATSPRIRPMTIEASPSIRASSR